MKKILALFLALTLALSLTACGTKSAAKSEDKPAESKPISEKVPELYVADVDGKATVVDADGKAVSGYKLDDGGSIVDGSGKVIVAAAQVKQLPAKAEEQPKTEEPKTDTADAKSGSSNRASSDVSSSSSSSGSSSGSSSSGGSESSSSSSSSGSSALTPTAPPQPVHTHSWQPVYRDVEVDDYEMKCFWYCNGCGADVTEILEAGNSMKQHYLETNNPNCLGYHDAYEQVKVGSHMEQQLTGYTCSCGATQSP